MRNSLHRARRERQVVCEPHTCTRTDRQTKAHTRTCTHTHKHTTHPSGQVMHDGRGCLQVPFKKHGTTGPPTTCAKSLHLSCAVPGYCVLLMIHSPARGGSREGHAGAVHTSSVTGKQGNALTRMLVRLLEQKSYSSAGADSTPAPAPVRMATRAKYTCVVRLTLLAGTVMEVTSLFTVALKRRALPCSLQSLERPCDARVREKRRGRSRREGQTDTVL